ncbi:MAG TPA: tRNA (adenosine(37)-N6)-threonylcarbamoyltransferase complex ATPase subunit type 1 TsaE [Caulobacteraceae bacterium]|jgi:tRNA threonylcarbamoyladenosine biosynthesis protein TsaE|nr:tRNA (adenosine(37)-N6)-threonylcarbamoyltransferase complex ATPase subunit type 1 TsaE [Caulobacteraceae bacterium]
MIVPAEGEFRLNQESDTRRLGAAIARELKRREAVCLSGPLGAGKSTLARGLIQALTGEPTEVPSPTFTLVQTYETPGLIAAHFDLYRLVGPDEVAELGLDDALDVGAAVIEWPEKLGHHLPSHRLDVELRIQGDARRARLSPHGAWEDRPIEF